MPAISMPTIVFHGNEDATVHCANGETVIRQALLADTTAFAGQAQPRQDTQDEQGQAAGRTFTRVQHRGSDGDVIAEHWVIEGAGHAWSGGSRRGSYTDQNGPDASGEMLRFFLDHRQ